MNGVLLRHRQCPHCFVEAKTSDLLLEIINHHREVECALTIRKLLPRQNCREIPITPITSTIYCRTESVGIRPGISDKIHSSVEEPYSFLWWCRGTSDDQSDEQKESNASNHGDLVSCRTSKVVARRGSRAPTKGGVHEASLRLREEAASAVAHPRLVLLLHFYGKISRRYLHLETSKFGIAM